MKEVKFYNVSWKYGIWIVIEQGEFKIFWIILVLPVVDFILCSKEERFLRSRKYFRANLWIVWCLLVVLKSIFIFFTNPSIGLAVKSLFENEFFYSAFSQNSSFLLHNSIFEKFSHYFFREIFAFYREIETSVL